MNTFQISFNYAKSCNPSHPMAYVKDGQSVMDINYTDTFTVTKHYFAFGLIVTVIQQESGIVFHYTTGHSASLMITIASTDSESVVVFNETYQRDAAALFQRGINAVGEHYEWPAEYVEEFRNKFLTGEVEVIG